ncbi:MAG TPA: ABC transporter substrate-binding protein [Bordetella sp.]
MKRPTLAARALRCLAAAATAAAILTAGAPAQAQPAPVKTLRMVAQADLKILDPTFTTAYITRNFGYMVYDTLFGMDSKGVPQPQMVGKYEKSADGLKWSFTLRPGLKFSDGAPVTTADVLASIQRWTAHDGTGRLMTAAGAQWAAADAQTFTLTLTQPFGLVLDALAKPSSFPLMIMPERLAKAPANAPLTEVLGSGPFMFKRDEWVPGNKVVFVKNPYYVPRSEPADGLAGGKKVDFDRMEWLYLPDANSAVAALKNNEVDYIEQVPPDYIAPLRAESDIKVGSASIYQGWIIMNQLHPPFDNPRIRHALLEAVSQEQFMAGMGYPADMTMKFCPGYFICGGSVFSSAGGEAYRTPDLEKAKKDLIDAGYKGEKVVLLVPSDVTYLNAEALMAAQTMQSIGMNVDMQTMDWASIGARRAKRDAPDAGGWNVYVTVAGRFDADTPVTHALLSAQCGNNLPGWFCDKTLDDLRAAWIRESDPAKRQAILDRFQARAYEVAPSINTGQYTTAYAVRNTVKGTEKFWGGLPLVWMLDK